MTGPLPSVKAMKKLALTVIAAVAWFLPAHLVILALLVFFWGTAMATTANTAKARSTEARVNGVVTQLGVTNTNVSNAMTTANNALPKSGGTVTGSLTVNGDHHIGGTLFGSGGSLAIGDATTISNNAAVTGTFYGSGGPGGPLHVDAATTVDTLNISAGAFFIQGNGITRQSAPGTAGITTLSQCINAVVATINTLKNTGWFT
jgi:hypothetical protein